jgi:hypothetical protein
MQETGATHGLCKYELSEADMQAGRACSCLAHSPYITSPLASIPQQH